MTKPRILIADDDPTIRLTARAVLESEGYEVSEAADGKRAVASVLSSMPDLMLLDLSMPEMDGFEVCEQLRSSRDAHDLPVVVLTGMDDETSARHAYEVGATDFITKPINYLVLVQRLRFVLRAQAAIRELLRNERRLAMAQEMSKLSHWESDLEGTLKAVSDSSTRLFPKAQPGQKLTTLIEPLHDQEPLRDALEALKDSGTPFAIEHSLVDIAGTSRIIQHHGRAIEEVGGRYLMGTTLDVTELAATREAALEATRLKSEFVANISHEIRTPLNGVLGMLELVLGLSLPEVARDFIATAQTSATRLLDLVNGILDLSKMEAGRMDLEIRPVVIGTLIEEVCLELYPQAQRKNVELALVLDQALYRSYRTDSTRLRQILTNLLGNAIKFTDAGYTRIDGRATTQGIELVVSDTGIGIPESALGSLFKPFTQADGSMTRRFGGTGLGLAITARLVELLGGAIELASEESVGSVFRVLLPTTAVETSVETITRPDAYSLLMVGLTEQEQETISAYVAELGGNTTAIDRIDDDTHSQEPWSTVVISESIVNSGLAETYRSAGCQVVVLVEPDTGLPENQRGIARLTRPIRCSELNRVLLDANSNRPQGESFLSRLTKAENLRVLLVEDNEVNKKVASAMLTRLGLPHDIASDGEQAVAASQSQDYQLILMDCQMPRLNGYEATAEIGRREATEKREPLPIVALTANSMEGDKARCLEAGMNDFLSKPINPRLLESVLQQWLQV